MFLGKSQLAAVMARSEEEKEEEEGGASESQLAGALFMLLFAHFVSETSKSLSLPGKQINHKLLKES